MTDEPYTLPEVIAAMARDTPPLVIPRHDPDAPLANVDRAAVHLIVSEYLRLGLVDRHHVVLDRQGLENSLITYCAMIRNGQAPVEGEET